MTSYGLKMVSKSLHVLMRMLLGFHTIIVRVWHVKSGHTCTIACTVKAARSVRRSLFMASLST